MRTLLAILIAGSAIAAETAPLPGIVYIPYDQADGVSLDSNGVMLPYEQFLRLWEAANPKDPTMDPAKPPVSAALSDFTLGGEVRGDLATLTLGATAVAVAEGWSTIRLPADLAPSTISAEDARVVVERRTDGLYLHLPAPGRYPIRAELSVAVAKDAGGRRSLVLRAPAAAAGRLDLRLADGEVDVSLTPAVAAQVVRDQGSTQVRAVIGASDQVIVAWQPPARAVTGEALLLSDGTTRLSVGERSLRYDLDLAVDILRRPVQDLVIALPPGAQVLAVDAEHLRSWEREGETLKLALHQAVEGRWRARIRLESLLDAQEVGSTRSITVAWPQVVGAGRSLGLIAIQAEEGLAVSVTAHEHLAQTDPARLDLPAGTSAYRHLATPTPSTIDVTRLASEIHASIEQLSRLAADEDQIMVAVHVDVRRAGVFHLDLEVPAAWETLAVDGLDVDEIVHGEVVGDLRPLRLALRSRLLGEGSVTLRFRAPPSIPTDGTSIGRDLGVARLAQARHQRGLLAVVAPRSWALTAGARSLLIGADLDQIRRATRLDRGLSTLAAGDDLALGFAWLAQGDNDPALRLDLAPRARELLLRQEDRILVSDSGVQRQVTWSGEVRFSPLPTLRLRGPVALADHLSFSGPGLADQRVVERGEADVVWELRFQTPVLGAFRIQADLRSPLPDLAPGQPAQVILPALRAEGASRLETVVAVAREGGLDVAATAAGLERVAAADLPAGLQGSGLVTGFRGAESVSVDLELVRHDLVRLADAAVSLAHYAAALGDDGRLRVLGRLSLRSRGRPWIALDLPEGADLLEVAVDGRAARPSRRNDGAIVIPLAEGGGDRVVAFIYEQRVLSGSPGGWSGIDLDLPRLASRGDAESAPLPVDRVEVALHLADDLAITGWSGDLSPLHRPTSTWRRWSARMVPALAPAQTDHGVPDHGGLTVPVPLDGVRHQLSRLGDGGHIGVTWIRRRWLDGAAFVLAALSLTATWILRHRRPVLAIITLGWVGLVLALAVPLQVLPLAGALGCGLGLVGIGVQALWSRWRQRPQSAAGGDPWNVGETSP